MANSQEQDARLQHVSDDDGYPDSPTSMYPDSTGVVIPPRTLSSLPRRKKKRTPRAVVSHPKEVSVKIDLEGARNKVSPSDTETPIAMEKTRPIQVFRIERDYSSGELCQFCTSFPIQLQGHVSETQHLSTINTLNSLLVSAHDPYKSIFDNLLSIFTLYARDLLGVKGHYLREMEQFKKALDVANATIYIPAGFRILDPQPVSYLFLEIATC